MNRKYRKQLQKKKRKQQKLEKIRKELNIDYNIPKISIISYLESYIYTIIQFICVIPLNIINYSFSYLNQLWILICSFIEYTCFSLFHILCYYMSIFVYSFNKILFTTTDETALTYDDLYERVVKLERNYVSLHNKHQKLQNKLKSQDILISKQKKSVITKVIHIKDTTQKPKSKESQVSKEVLPIIKSIPPPPPILPPPPPKVRKLNIPKRKISGIKMNNTNNIPTPGVTLQSVLGAKGNLKKISPQTSQKLPLPSSKGFGLSLSDINSVKLRRNRNINQNSQSNNVKSKLPVFRLRNTNVKRSPGGTPMKENINENLDSPANILSNALRKKFENTKVPSPYESPNQSKQSNHPPSPYESPKLKAITKLR